MDASQAAGVEPLRRLGDSSSLGLRLPRRAGRRERQIVTERGCSRRKQTGGEGGSSVKAPNR